MFKEQHLHMRNKKPLFGLFWDMHCQSMVKFLFLCPSGPIFLVGFLMCTFSWFSSYSEMIQIWASLSCTLDTDKNHMPRYIFCPGGFFFDMVYWIFFFLWGDLWNEKATSRSFYIFESEYSSRRRNPFYCVADSQHN